MDRKIVYPGQIPLETDLLLTNKFALTGMARLAEVMLGSNTCLYGFECRPGQGKPLSVHVSEGQIYHREETDRTSFSTLGPDNETKILKQGYSQAQDFELTPPKVPGHSLCYLLQMKYIDEDTGDTVLPYYNATHPAAGFSGPDNSGKTQHTVRAGRCMISLKAGVSAITGTEKIPDSDADYAAAWVITVKHDATMLSARDIVMHPGAPFIPPQGLLAAVQLGALNTGTDAGSQDNYCVAYHPAITRLKDGLRLYFRTFSTNAGPCTLEVKGFEVKNILTAVGEKLEKETINTNRLVAVEWNAALDSWILRDHAGGYSKAQADKTFLLLKGGVVSGDVTVEGVLSLAHALKIGEAELSPGGDITGNKWGGSLHKWLSNRQLKSGIKDGKWWWKDPGSKILVQGGQLTKSDNNSVDFPVAFSRSCHTVIITQAGKSGMSRNNTSVTSVDNFRFYIDAGKGETSFYWVAFGFC